MQPWHLYVLLCADGTLYTGISTDVKRRLHEHNHTKRGAKYTRCRRPVVLLGSTEYPNQVEAARAEYAVKKLTPTDKRKLVEWFNRATVGTGAPTMPPPGLLPKRGKVKVV